MGVFLRWGIFGILAVAAMVYAYNASKRIAENRQPQQTVVVSQADEEEAVEEAESDGTRADEESETESEPPEALPADCEQERLVAERALKMRRDGEPLDRLLRIEAIVFQSNDQRREHLETVARRWFERKGADPDGATLRSEVLRDCRPSDSRVSPEP